METSSDEFILGFESSSPDSSEIEEDTALRKRPQIQKVDVRNAHDGENLISGIIPAPEILLCYSDTSGDESSDYQRSHILIDNNIVQVPADTKLESSVLNGSETSTDLKTTKTMLKLFSPNDKTPRKRKREPQNWKKNKAALMRAKGEAYKSYSGKDIPKKTPNLGMLCNEACPFQCSVKFSKEQREKLFFDFYKLNVNDKNALLYSCISKVNVQRQRKNANKHKSSSFHYMVKNECETVRVCKTALAAIFKIGRGKIDHIQKFIKAGHSIPPPDCRGKHMIRPHRISPEVVDYIKDHIRSFSCQESHYSQTKNMQPKKFLSPLLSLRKMYCLYLGEVSANDKPEQFKVTESTYRHIFSSKFNISFGHPRSETLMKLMSNHRQAFDMQEFDRELSDSKE